MTKRVKSLSLKVVTVDGEKAALLGCFFLGNRFKLGTKQGILEMVFYLKYQYLISSSKKNVNFVRC